MAAVATACLRTSWAAASQAFWNGAKGWQKSVTALLVNQLHVGGYRWASQVRIGYINCELWETVAELNLPPRIPPEPATCLQSQRMASCQTQLAKSTEKHSNQTKQRCNVEWHKVCNPEMVDEEEGFTAKTLWEAKTKFGCKVLDMSMVTSAYNK